jgi:hypothetical protein
MTQLRRFGLGLLALGAVSLLPSAGSAQQADSSPEMTPAEREIWQLEEAYWRYVRTGRVEDFRTLWYHEFASWPCQTPEPELPTGTGDWLTEIRERNLSVTYELRPKMVKRFGDVAVTQYAVQFVYDYGGEETEFGDTWWKITHTWKRAGDRWAIIGGMCGLLEWEER